MDDLSPCIPVSLVFISNFSRIHPRSCHQLEQYPAGNLFLSLSVVFFRNGLDCLRKRAGNMSRLSDTALVFNYSIAMFSGGLVTVVSIIEPLLVDNDKTLFDDYLVSSPVLISAVFTYLWCISQLFCLFTLKKFLLEISKAGRGYI